MAGAIWRNLAAEAGLFNIKIQFPSSMGPELS